MPGHAHLKLHDQFVALIAMKLHAQYQPYTSISFWDIKDLKASFGMPDHTHLNINDKFTTLIDMALHAQNQLYTFFRFWDLKVSIVSLSMPIVRKGVPVPTFLRHPPLDLACPPPLFFKPLSPHSSFLFHPLLRHFKQFRPSSCNPLLP